MERKWCDTVLETKILSFTNTAPSPVALCQGKFWHYLFIQIFFFQFFKLYENHPSDLIRPVSWKPLLACLMECLHPIAQGKPQPSSLQSRVYFKSGALFVKPSRITIYQWVPPVWSSKRNSHNPEVSLINRLINSCPPRDKAQQHIWGMRTRGLDTYCCCKSCKYLMRKIKHMLYLEDTLNINMLNMFMFSHVKRGKTNGAP